jgi:DNA adenine methylase
VAALWQAAFNPDLAEELAGLVEQAPLTLKHWIGQRWAEPDSVFMQCHKCIYLNGTSFSGTLSQRLIRSTA